MSLGHMMDNKTIYLDNVKEPTKSPYTGESGTTLNGLSGVPTKTGGHDPRSIDKFIRLLSDVWHNFLSH